MRMIVIDQMMEMYFTISIDVLMMVMNYETVNRSQYLVQVLVDKGYKHAIRVGRPRTHSLATVCGLSAAY